MRLRSPRTLLQASRSLRFISTDPFVAGLPADPEVVAQIAEVRVVLQICGDELHPFGHPVGPRPRHRVVLLGPPMMLASCNPCPRSELLPVCPVWTRRFYLTEFARSAS